jgi:hypothetical protein
MCGIDGGRQRGHQKEPAHPLLSAAVCSRDHPVRHVFPDDARMVAWSEVTLARRSDSNLSREGGALGQPPTDLERLGVELLMLRSSMLG